MDISGNSGSAASPGRRRILSQLGLAATGSLVLPSWLNASGNISAREALPHPHIFWRSQKTGNLRTIAEVQETIRKPGAARNIWLAIEAACATEFDEAPLTCRSAVPGRPESSVRLNNPDYIICRAAGHRVLRHALALLVTGDERYKTAALRQLEALFDPSVWPDWIDQAHLRFDLPADLRTGMLSQDTAIAFDWLYPFLDDKEKDFILEGIDRRGIRPYLRSMAADPWWAHDLNNWYTVIIGGLGIAGMALAGDHPKAARLVDISLPKMRDYLKIYGEDGSFNESVAYSGATRIPVAYFYAYYYHRAGGVNPLAEHPFPETAEWTIYATLPPGRFATFGDGWVDAPVQVEFMTAIAAATRNPVFQGFAARHLETEPNPYELLWFDPQVKSSGPAGKLPLGKAFHDNSALVFSRTSWDPVAPAMIVYGKAKRAENHEHNDLGQVCIDVRGKRMITDPGSPSSYPPDFFDEARFQYYNASVRGHNVFMFGGREQVHLPHNRGKKERNDLSPINGRYLNTHFDEQNGGTWQMDLSRAYAGAAKVLRTVIHCFPGWVAVLDEAVLEKPEEISLRWHTVEAPLMGSDGNFEVVNAGSRLACRIELLDGSEYTLSSRRHAYEPPYNLNRTGTPLEERREPYVELLTHGKHCRVLSLFALDEASGETAWTRSDGKWSWENEYSTGEVTLQEKLLCLRDVRGGHAIEAALP